MQPGRILMAQGELPGAGFNRAPAGYAQNPAQERARRRRACNQGEASCLAAAL